MNPRPAPGERELLASLSGLVAKLAARMSRHCRCAADRDEVLADAWVGALRAVRCHDPARSALVTWARKAIVFEVLDGFRRRCHAPWHLCRAGKAPALVPLPALLPAGGPDHAAAAERADHAERLLACLPPRDRLILWRVVGEGWLQADAARAAGVAPSRVSQIVTRGLALVRDLECGRM